MNEDTHLLLIPKNKNAPKYQHFYLATQMEHKQSSYFCRGPDDFCWGPAPVGPTLVTGLSTQNLNCFCVSSKIDTRSGHWAISLYWHWPRGVANQLSITAFACILDLTGVCWLSSFGCERSSLGGS